MKGKSVLIVILFVVIGGCTEKEKDPFRQIMVDNLEQCVTPLSTLNTYAIFCAFVI